MGILFQLTTARLRLRLLALPRPRLAAAEALRIPAFRYFWGSFGPTNLAYQMRMMVVAWIVLDLTDSQLRVGLVNGLPGFAINRLLSSGRGAGGSGQSQSGTGSGSAHRGGGGLPGHQWNGSGLAFVGAHFPG